MMLLVRIVENNKIDEHFRAGKVKLVLALAGSFRKEIRKGPCSVIAPLKLFSTSVNPAFNWEVHLIHYFFY